MVGVEAGEIESLDEVLDSCVFDVERAFRAFSRPDTQEREGARERESDSSDAADAVVTGEGDRGDAVANNGNGDLSIDEISCVRRRSNSSSSTHSGSNSPSKESRRNRRRSRLSKQHRFPLASPAQFWAFRQAVEAVEQVESQSAGNSSQGDADAAGLASLTAGDGQLAHSVSRLDGFVGICDSVSLNISRGQQLLDDLESKHQTVSEKTSSLHETCKKLLEEQQVLEKTAADIQVPLEYLSELDRIGPLLGLPLDNRLEAYSKKLHANDDDGAAALTSSGGAGDRGGTVRAINPDSPEFFGLIRRLDECLDYVEDHPEFKDYEHYSSKFQQLHFRGLSLVRNLIVDSLRATSTSAKAGIESKIESSLRQQQQQLKSNGSNDNTYSIQERLATFDSEVNSLIFVRFRAQAKQLRPYVSELEGRADQKDAAELLFSCHKSYTMLRLDLLNLVVPRARDLSLRSDLLQTLRAAAPYLLTVCRNEHRLFNDFFDCDATELIGAGEQFKLRTLSRQDSDGASSVGGQSFASSSANSRVSDAVAARDAFLDMMTELCGILYDLVRPQIVQLNDLKTLCEIVRTVEGDIVEGYAEVLGTAGQALHVVLIQIIRDVQERLIYSASRYVTHHIAQFKPKPEDLRYPEILLDIANGKSTNSSRSGILAGCYKSLDNTLQCLIWIYRCVEPPTFEELAQEAVACCTESLKSASALISNKSRVDGDLFFIKHLLVLREQISPFNTQMAVKQMDLDFASTTAAFGDFLMHTRNIFSRHNNALLDLFVHGVPTIKEREIDCKRDLETQLKQACENFIVRTYEQSLAALIAFLQRAAKPITDENKSFAEQDFALPERVEALLTSCLTSVPECLGMIRGKMSLYLVNAQTEQILFNPIKANIFAALTQMSNCVEANYSQEQAKTMLLLVASLRKQITKVEMLDTSEPVSAKDQDSAAPSVEETST